MLKVKAFKISDDEGVNDLLSQYRLASGAHILVSNGEIMIPYEDGAPETATQRIVAIKEQKNMMLKELWTMQHSQLVVEMLMADAEGRVAVATERWKGYTSSKDLEKKKNEAQAAYDQLFNQHLQNQYELARLQINMEMFDKQIDELDGQ